MAYTYKINSYEAYPGTEVATIACDVMAYLDGIMLAHKTVLVDAKLLNAEVISKDSAAVSTTKVTDMVVAQDKELSTDWLDGVVAKLTAKELAYQEAVVVVDKVRAKIDMTSVAVSVEDIKPISEDIIIK